MLTHLTSSNPDQKTHKCEICFNCPLHGSTFILDKDAHNHMLQYNAHHSNSKPNFDKNEDSKVHGPQNAVLPMGNHASMDSIDAPDEFFDTNQDYIESSIDSTVFNDLNGTEIVDTTTFQIPAPDGRAGYIIAPEHLHGADPLDDIVDDPFHY